MRFKTYALAVVGALLPSSALAFNFGFARVPDYMDKYLIWLFFIMLPFLIGLLLTKPNDVPFKEVFRQRKRLSSIANFFCIMWAITFISMMTLFFIGMGLQRAAEG